MYNEFENRRNYIEQGLKQGFNLNVINQVGCVNSKSVIRLVTRGNVFQQLYYMHI